MSLDVYTFWNYILGFASMSISSGAAPEYCEHRGLEQKDRATRLQLT
jgi:hypothetical protein